MYFLLWRSHLMQSVRLRVCRDNDSLRLLRQVQRTRRTTGEWPLSDNLWLDDNSFGWPILYIFRLRWPCGMDVNLWCLRQLKFSKRDNALHRVEHDSRPRYDLLRSYEFELWWNLRIRQGDKLASEKEQIRHIPYMQPSKVLLTRCGLGVKFQVNML